MKKEPEIAIKVNNVSKTFFVPTERRRSIKSYFINPFRRIEKRKFEALKNISFEVKKGEFLGIVGKNGSGKSTLLKLIAGIYQPDEGEISVKGKIVPFLELGVGFNPELSGRENIFLNGTILGMSRKYLEEKFDEIVDFAELREFLDLPLKNYSSGMQVRLAFSIAIQTDADIFILDEILAVGDATFQEKSLQVMTDLRRSGKTIIYVSHDLKSISKYSDRTVLIDRGTLVAIDSPGSVLARYNKLLLDEQKQYYGSESDDVEEKKQHKNQTYIRNVVLKGHNDNIYQHMKDIHICVELGRKGKVLNKYFHVGIGIYNVDGSYVFGTNTELDNKHLDVKTDRICLTIKNNTLLNGRYFVNVVLFEQSEREFVDFRGRTAFFEIQNAPQYRGCCLLNHVWEKNDI